MVLRLRELTAEERAAIDQLAHARTAPARRVERARIIAYASRGEGAPAIAERLRLDAYAVRGWIHRFNAEGLAGLEDRPRAGRPPTYAPAQVAAVIAAALTDPRALDLPFASWTLDRLAAYLNERKGIIAIKRSRIDEILLAEGLRWRRHESWFGARVDPEFAGKRGGSRPSTRRRLKAAWSSAWTRWGPRAPRPFPAAPWSRGRSGPSGRSTTGGAAGATSSAPSAPPPAKPSPGRIRHAAPPAGWRSSTRSEGWLPPGAEAERVHAVVDNLSAHRATDVLLFMLAHPRWEMVFQPAYAAYLSLIEPWRKVLRSLALKGRRFEGWDEIARAVAAATAYWNAHRHPFVWGHRRRHRPRRHPGIALPPKAA